jgi:hypothetical protein
MHMKKVKLISSIVLAVSMILIVLWRLLIPFPDCAVRIIGVVMMGAIFALMYSSVKNGSGKD